MRVPLPLLLLWVACGNGEEEGGAGAAAAGQAPETRAPKAIAAKYRDVILAPQAYDFPPGLVFSYPSGWAVKAGAGGLTIAPKKRGHGALGMETCVVTLAEVPRAKGVMSTAFVRQVRNLAATALRGYKEIQTPGVTTIGGSKWGMMAWRRKAFQVTSLAVMYTHLQGGRRISVMVRSLEPNLRKREHKVLAMLFSMNMAKPRMTQDVAGKWAVEGGETESDLDPVTISEMKPDGRFVVYRAELRAGVYTPTATEKTRGHWAAHKGRLYEASSRTKGVWLETGKYKISGTPGKRRMEVTASKQVFIYNEIH